MILGGTVGTWQSASAVFAVVRVCECACACVCGSVRAYVYRSVSVLTLTDRKRGREGTGEAGISTLTVRLSASSCDPSDARPQSRLLACA